MTDFPETIKAYTPEVCCGQGGYGAVWRVRDAVGSSCALKIVYKNSIADWRQEFNGLTFYKNKVSPHPNLVRIFHIENSMDFFYYTMECADDSGNGETYLPDTLKHRIKQYGALDPVQLADIFGQLAVGLEHLHNAGLIHRDIKPENIIFAGGIPKFGDIGLVSLTAHSGNLAGTQCFIPPEYLTGQKRKLKPDIDLYAFGKTLYCALSGQEPEQYPLLAAAVLRDPRRRQLNQLVKHLCATDPRRRINTISGIIIALAKTIAQQPGVPTVFSTAAQQIRRIGRVLAVVAILFLIGWSGKMLLNDRRLMKTELQRKPISEPIPPVPHVESVKTEPPIDAVKPAAPVHSAKTTPKQILPKKPLVAGNKSAINKARKPARATLSVRRIQPTSPPMIEAKKQPSSALSRRLYHEVQQDICEAIYENEYLKPVLADVGDIPEEDIVIDSFYPDNKGGRIYEFRIPSKQIRGKIRILHLGAITIRGLGYFYVKDQKIQFPKPK